MLPPTIINRDTATYYFKRESIIMERRNQYVALHCYDDLRQLWRLELVGREIQNNAKITPDEVFFLCRQHKVQILSTSAGACMQFGKSKIKNYIRW